MTKDGKLVKKILKEGYNQITPKKGDTVEVHYEGRLLSDSSVFDSSYGKDPFETKIGVGKVIKGWDIGIMTMGVGEKAILSIESDYAYGNRDVGGIIPPGSTLVFEVELMSVNGKKRPTGLSPKPEPKPEPVKEEE